MSGPVTARNNRRVLLTLVVWLVVSCVAAAGLLALQPMIGLSPDILTLVMLAPAIGAGVVWIIPQTRPARTGDHAPVGAFLRAVGLAVLVALLYFVVIAVVLGRTPQLSAVVAGVPIEVVLVAQFAGALAEETGFRGLLLPALTTWFPRWGAAAVCGLLFGLWHIQYFALPFLDHAAFLIGAIALTMTMSMLMTGSYWQRMAVCTIVHTGANLALASTAGSGPVMPALALATVLGCVLAGSIHLVRGREAAAHPE